MKRLIGTLVVLVFAVAYAQDAYSDILETVKNYRKDCLEKTGVEESLAKNTLKGEFADDPKLKEYLLCFSKKFNFQNDAGEFQVEDVRKKTIPVSNEEIANNVVSKCLKQKATPQESAFEMWKCWHGEVH